jgi:hypothetical protein
MPELLPFERRTPIRLSKAKNKIGLMADRRFPRPILGSLHYWLSSVCQGLESPLFDQRKVLGAQRLEN